MWELSSKEFLNFKHGKDSNNIYHLLWAHYVADNVLSIYYLFTFLNPHKKTIWDYFHFWDKRSKVWASQLISDKAGIKSQGFPRLHRRCALKFHTPPGSLNSNVCKGQSIWESGLQVGSHSMSSLLSFVNSLLIEIWVQIDSCLPLKKKKKKKSVKGLPWWPSGWFHCRRHEFDPWSGTKIPHDMWYSQKAKKKKASVMNSWWCFKEEVHQRAGQLPLVHLHTS